MPGRHPDDDLLADLAADVLPADRARAVEAHVAECARCAGLLDDAERVRGLLLADDPGPVPADVWARVEAALAAAAPAAPAPSSGPAAVPTAADGTATADTAAFRAFVDRPATPPRPTAPIGNAAWAPGDADPSADPSHWNGADRDRKASGVRPRAGSRPSLARRDARDRPDRRRSPLLLVAAAVLGLVAVAGTIRLAWHNGSSTASLSTGSGGQAASGQAASGQAVPGAASGASAARVVRSGHAYRASTLAADATALMTAATAGAVKPGTDKASGLTSRPEPVPPDAAADDVTNPQRLAACVTALGSAPERVVAVDLGTYDGREAAVVVLTASSGGHEVWVVERTCSSGREGALKYVLLPG